MSFKKFFLFLLCILALSTASPAFSCSSATFLSINQKNEVTLTITDSYYTDLDKDDVLDIASSFYLLFDCTKRHTVKLYVSLILPSGFEFSYKWTIGTKHLVFFGQIHFYDHVIESGNYTLSIQAKILTGGANSGIAEYIFDPPGGSGGGDPCARLM